MRTGKTLICYKELTKEPLSTMKRINLFDLYKEPVSEVLEGYTSTECTKSSSTDKLRLLSLFSGCGGMDIGFEGGFICHKKSINPKSGWVDSRINKDWIKVKDTGIKTVFANDILTEAKESWISYMSERGHSPNEYHLGSIVDLVKKHDKGEVIFPDNIDIVTGGFPCQDFSVAGKRKGFESLKDHNGRLRDDSLPTEETRGKLYYWMKQVIDITKPKVFIAENVKGLVNLGDVKKIIQQDFATADDNGYIVLDPQILHAADYGVPESRERVIFIGIRKNALCQEALDALSQEIIPNEYNPYPAKTHAFSQKGDSLLDPVVCGDVFNGMLEPDQSQDLTHRFFSRAKYMGNHCQGQKEISLEKIGPTIRSEHHGNIEFRRLSREHGGLNIEEIEKGLPERRLTPRECAMIQTFPPDYNFVRFKEGSLSRFKVSSSGAYKVIGNAVPPVLAYNIAMRIKSLWSIYF